MFYKYNAELLCLFSHVSSCFHGGPSDNLHMLHSSKMIQFLLLASLPWQPDSFLEPTFLLAYHLQSRGRRPDFALLRKGSKHCVEIGSGPMLALLFPQPAEQSPHRSPFVHEA